MSTNKTSETSGFENIGKFYSHILMQENLKSIHRDIYMLMVKYSFGYTKDIKFELSISIRQISSKLNISPATVIRGIETLIEHKLIERVKWQDFGPKQKYRYKIKFPKDFHISIKEPEEKRNDCEVSSLL